MRYSTSILSAILILAIATACSNSSTGSEPEHDPVFGAIEVLVITTGEDDDPDGYTVSVEGGESKEIGPNGTVTFTQVITGNKTVILSGIPGHCTVEGTPSEAFNLGESETRTIEFEVSCTAIFRDKILFLRGNDNSGYQLNYMDTDGGNLRIVTDLIFTSTASPAASPDGLKVIFAWDESGGDSRQIWVMNSDGSGLQNLTQNPGMEHGGSVWSPDGNKIAFHARPVGGNLGSFDIYVMDADGTNVVNITDSQFIAALSPSWSPDGSQIVYSSSQAEAGVGVLYSIAIINDDGSGRNLIIEGEPNVINTEPSWSPEGSNIAFERFTIGGGASGLRQIHLVNADGSNIRNISMEGGSTERNANASWSPDGSQIVFNKIPTFSVRNIYIMNTDGEIQGSSLTNGADDSDNHINPSWSPFTRN